MQLFYNDFAIHEIGELVISKRQKFEGGEAPYRAQVELLVKVTSFARSWEDNFDLMFGLAQALKTQQAQLRWVNEDTDEAWVDQTASVATADLPEDKSGWGQYMMEQGIVFVFYENDVITNSVGASFQKLGVVDPAVPLGEVLKWSETYVAKRPSELHPNRTIAVIKLNVSGVIRGDTKLPLANRRAAMLDQKARLMAHVNGANGTLTFGKWSQVVKVEELKCDLNQLVSEIPWSFTALYTVFPDEVGYATCEWSAPLKDNGGGWKLLNLTGKVVASSESYGRERWDAIRAAVLKQNGFVSYETRQIDSTPASISTNADGDTFLEIGFSEEYRRFDDDNLLATFTGNGSKDAVSLGNVTKWDDEYTARRFSDLHSQRERAGGMIVAEGVFVPSKPSDNQATKRLQLESMRKALVDQVNRKDGRLVYGTVFDQTVRVENFRAHVDQEKWAIRWTMNAVWTRFPNEAGYATVTLEVDQRRAFEEGDQYLTMNGRILAQDETAARAKLSAVRSAVLQQYGYTLGNLLRDGSKVNSASANEDGDAFLELSFNEEYRQRLTNLISYQVKSQDKESVRSGFINTTVSGYVVSGGATVDAAYAAGLAKVRELGEGQYPFCESSSITWDERQVQAVGDNPSPVELVRLEYSYEYQRKGTKIYLEWTAETNAQTFGADSEVVRGMVVAADIATARTVYQSQVKAGYASRLIRDEVVTEARQSLSQTGSSYTTQEIRIDFGFSAYKTKASGKKGIRYGISISQDWLALQRETLFEGTVWAADETAAATFLAEMITGLSMGSSVRSRRSEAHEDDGTNEGFLELRFEEQFVAAITGVDGVRECEVTEEVRYSGNRNVVLPVLNGAPVVQTTGQTEGGRTVSGSVTAATEAIADAWILKQRGLLSGTGYENPAQVTSNWVFVPAVEGVARGSGANARLVKKNFQFSEIIPSLGAPWGQ